MPNITITEWADVESRIAEALAERWPWLHRRTLSVTLSVEAPVMTVSAELAWNWAGDDASAKVRIRVDSSACTTGGLLEIAETARQVAEVRDAMLYVYGETSSITVWRDGECPCGYCGGRGVTQGRTCERCGGKGKR